MGWGGRAWLSRGGSAWGCEAVWGVILVVVGVVGGLGEYNGGFTRY